MSDDEPRRITCIVCPRGYQLLVDSRTLAVSGNHCPRGEQFGQTELKTPLRMLTGTVAIRSATEAMLPVRSAREIPRAQVIAAMQQLRRTAATAPVAVGSVILEDLAGTGVPLIATKRVDR